MNVTRRTAYTRAPDYAPSAGRSSGALRRGFLAILLTLLGMALMVAAALLVIAPPSP